MLKFFIKATILLNLMIIPFHLLSTDLIAAVLDEVIIEGYRRVPLSNIEQYTLKAGEEYSIELIDETVKTLYSTGLFLDIGVDFEVVDGKVILTYIIDEMPLISTIRFEGNETEKASKLKEEVSLKRGDKLSFIAVEKAMMDLLAFYEDENRYGTKIAFSIEERTVNSVDVIFTIEEAAKSKIYNIILIGNKNIPDDKIKSAIPTQERHFWTIISSSGKIQKDMIIATREIIRLLYLTEGYAKVSVSEPELSIDDDDPDKINMTIKIEENSQYKVRSIAYTKNDIVPQEDLKKATLLQVDGIFNIQQYQQDILSLTGQFSSIGYADANIEPVIQLDDETKEVDITYKIDPGNLVTVNRIEIEGNRTTRDNVIRRQIDQLEGEIYNSRYLNQARANIMSTGYFSNVEIREEQVTPTTVDVIITVEEESTGSFTFGVAYSTLDGLLGSVQLQRNNFLGLGHTVSLQAEVSKIRTDFSFSYTEPWLFDWQVSAGLDAFNMTYVWDEYTRSSTGGSIRLGHAIVKRRLFMNYRFSMYNVNIYDIPDDASEIIKSQKGRIWTHSFSPSIIWNNLDNYIDPKKGNKSELYVDLAGTILGGDADFVKVGAESVQFIPLFANIVLFLRVKVGFIFPTGDSPIPIDERFRLGGINSVRGFGYGDISPTDSAGYRYGGDKFAQGNVELIFPLKEDIKLRGLIFFDIGQVNDVGEALFENGTRESIGAGIRWSTPMGMFRLEFGYKLDKKPEEDPYRFEFSIGGTF